MKKTNNREGKVLILSCGTGGGHNTAAKAVQEKLIEKGIKADFIEYLDIINSKVKDKVNNLYLTSTRREGKIFKNVYKLGEIYEKTKLKSPVYMLNSLNKEKLYKYIKTNNYQYIITTHLFAAQALTAIKKDHEIHFMQIATDYVSIPFWKETNPDYFVIPSADLEKDFVKKGIDEKKIIPLGIPVSKSFIEENSKEKCKDELNLEHDKKYVLILNGSMGFGNITELVENLIDKTKETRYIVSCGNNEQLLNTLNTTYKNNERVITLPYTNKLSKYMQSSEVVLSKPGGLTTTEVAVMRKPLIHILPIPGCENYNADFFNNRKMSIKCKNIDEIIINEKRLLEDTNLQNELIQNQEKYIKRNTSEEIAKVIMKELN